ncbi:type II secretion system minor pseudopilin GspI [Sphingomonas sp. XXL09]|uniref:type II secretion system minor pseudopilin GspI n=1 Tax=Sphingomonas sp. XXL09 TaxID=3457787 RepID=UPI00406BD416
MRAMPKRRRRRDRAGAGEQGFTLIEIMVALAVFSLAVLALVRLESATIRGATILDDTLVANLVARNVANEALTEGRVPTLGRSAGVENNAGRAWRWVRDVRPTGNARIVRIDVAVADRRGVPIGRATAVRPPDDQP